MYTKTITYSDFNGHKRTEDFQFNMSKAEMLEKEMGCSGGWSNYVDQIIKAEDLPTLISLFKQLLLETYGKKSPDGRQFIKSPELSKEFSQTEAYSQMFLELATNAKAAAEFMNGIVPADLSKQLAEIESEKLAKNESEKTQEG